MLFWWTHAANSTQADSFPQMTTLTKLCHLLRLLSFFGLPLKQKSLLLFSLLKQYELDPTQPPYSKTATLLMLTKTRIINLSIDWYISYAFTNSVVKPLLKNHPYTKNSNHFSEDNPRQGNLRSQPETRKSSTSIQF